jgi:hypothetical protein
MSGCQEFFAANLYNSELNMTQKRRTTRNEKIFYILSILLVISMVIGLIAVAITPSTIGF